MSGLQIVAGVVIGSIATGNVTGVVAGSTLIMHGVVSGIEEIGKLSSAPNPSNPDLSQKRMLQHSET